MKSQNETLNNTQHMLKSISTLPIGTGFLAFRDMKKILDQPIQGAKALDFGCGAGRSTRLLSSYGFDVTGVDIDEEMINEAKNLSGDINGFVAKRLVCPERSYSGRVYAASPLNCSKIVRWSD